MLSSVHLDELLLLISYGNILVLLLRWIEATLTLKIAAVLYLKVVHLLLRWRASNLVIDAIW